MSGLSFIDKKKLLMARIIFRFLAKNKPVQQFRKTNNIPGANWLKHNTAEFQSIQQLDIVSQQKKRRQLKMPTRWSQVTRVETRNQRQFLLALLHGIGELIVR